MLVTLIMCAGILVGRLLLPDTLATGNGRLQTALTLLLIFSMGLSIGGDENLLADLPVIGVDSLIFCVLEMAASTALVFLVTRRLFDKGARK